jgi:hypothetical protein
VTASRASRAERLNPLENSAGAVSENAVFDDGRVSRPAEVS